MSKNNKKMEGSKVSAKGLDLNDVEMVFGTPDAPKKSPVPDVRVDITNEKKQGNGDPHPKRADSDQDGHSAQPLLELDRGHQKPPLAGPEVDDLDDEKPPADAAPYPGIDDGLLDHHDKEPHDHEHEHPREDSEHPEHPHDGSDEGNWHVTKHGTDEPDFYYGDGFIGNGLHNRLGEDRPGSPMIPGIDLENRVDVNTYQQKKNLAQGMMDLALLSANANQLRYVLESSMSHPYYYPSLVFITCSIILQIAVGVGLIMNSRYNVKDEKDICKADKINNMTILGIFLITIVNVFITSFSVATPTNANAAVQSIQQVG